MDLLLLLLLTGGPAQPSSDEPAPWDDTAGPANEDGEQPTPPAQNATPAPRPVRRNRS